MPELEERGDDGDVVEYSSGDQPLALNTDKRFTVRLLRKKRVVILWDRMESKRLPYHQFLLYDGDEHVLTAQSDENGEYHPPKGDLPNDWSIDVIGPGPDHPYWSSLNVGEDADEELEGEVAEPEPDDDDEDTLDEDA